MPGKEDDLFVAATSNHVLVFDNLSGLKPDTSDQLCRLCTGGGITKRKHYTNADQVTLSATRPMILNGISSFVKRADLADRAVLIDLQPIEETQRKNDTDFWKEFEQTLPQILGAVFDVMVTGLEKLPTVELDRSPRMTDFAKWCVAIEGPLGGGVMDAYRASMKWGSDEAQEANPLVSGVVEWLDSEENARKGSQGLPANALLKELHEFMESQDRQSETSKDNGWPQSPSALGSTLKRIAPLLRQKGIEWRVDRSKRKRLHRFGKMLSPPSPTSNNPKSLCFMGDGSEGTNDGK